MADAVTSDIAYCLLNDAIVNSHFSRGQEMLALGTRLK